MENKIIIVGAGYAGVLTAKKLEKKFRKEDKVDITIIDKHPFHTMLTELHEVAANRVDEDSIKMSLKKIFSGRRVKVALDTVESIDFSEKQVIGINDIYNYDYLVLAAGSKPAFFGVPGAKEFSYTLWSYEDAINLRDRIQNSFRKAALEKNPEEKKRLLTFYIVGASFTGIEMAGELAEYAHILSEKFDIERHLINICVVDQMDRTVPNLPDKLSDKVETRLNRMGVSVMLNTFVCGIGPDYIELKKTADCSKLSAGTVIWVAGIESADVTNEAANKLGSVERGRIQVDAFLRSTTDDQVFVIGDNMFYIPEGEQSSVPQMVENCEQSSLIAANNIYCAVTGKGEMKRYRPAFHGIMVSVGGRYGVARVGSPKRMYNLPSFLAMFSKHLINIIYFLQVLGWNKVFSYIKYEFFTIKDRRSFVGGHFTNRTPSFLLVPLRVWLGVVWLFEGIMKIVDGWFAAPKLTEFFGDANSWYNSIINKTTAFEAVSSATGGLANPSQTSNLGTVLINFNFLDLIHFILVSGRNLANSTLNDYAFRLDIPILNWFTNTLILSSGTMQIIMQVIIIVAEILIGLALIGGLLTTPAAFSSLVLQLMFVCTTGIYLGTIWMVFAGIAVLIAAGRIFGLDYYFMPHLHGWWTRLPFVRRLYIYND